MKDFSFYFKLGWEHIISTEAADHLLFILALAAIYQLKNWKNVLILVTAFTIGHSLTLALSVYNVIKVNSSWVEFLIPVTIIITGIFNLAQKRVEAGKFQLNYFLALFFGLIHGLGFANSIRFMLAGDQSIGVPLFAFNTGLEAGQIVVVACILLLSQLAIVVLKLPAKAWVWLLSITAVVAATFMAIERWPIH